MRETDRISWAGLGGVLRVILGILPVLMVGFPHSAAAQPPVSLIRPENNRAIEAAAAQNQPWPRLVLILLRCVGHPSPSSSLSYSRRRRDAVGGCGVSC